MNTKSNNRIKAFSLIETITVLVISALVLIATVNIYTRIRAAAAAIDKVILENELPNEILQRLAEDIDRLAVPGFDTTITIEHKTDGEHETCRMIMKNFIYDSKDRKETYEEIVWQTAVDPDYGSLDLYRLHTGMNVEKNIAYDIDTPLEPEGEVFIRMAVDLTQFTVEIVKGDELLDIWTQKTLPKALYATVSFAPYQENEFGEAEIPQEQLISRTIAVDRTRNIEFEFVAKDFSNYDPNNPDAYIDPNDAGLEF